MKVIKKYFQVGVSEPTTLNLGEVIPLKDGLYLLRYIEDPIFHFKKGNLDSITLKLLVDKEPDGTTSFHDINNEKSYEVAFSYEQFRAANKRQVIGTGNLYKQPNGNLVSLGGIIAINLSGEYFSVRHIAKIITPFSRQDKQMITKFYREAHVVEVKGGN